MPASAAPSPVLTRDPVRDPRQATGPERRRRAGILLLLTLLVPGGAQAVAGSRRWGRIALRVTLAVWAAVLLALVLALTARAALVSVLANPVVLVLLGVALVALAIGWGLLWVDTFRLIRVHLLGPRARAATAAATAVALVVTSGGLGYTAWMTQSGRGALGSIFGSGPAIEAADGRYNILVMGGDAGEDRVGLRPDSMHVASVDAETGAVTLFSLPRNLQNAPFTPGSPLWQAYPNGFDCGDDCILNALYMDVEEKHKDLYPDAEHPGAEAMMDAAGGVLGLEITGYAMMDMAGFAELVDAMGGVDVVSGGYVTHRGARPDGTWGDIWWEPGTHHFGGDDALAFARSRKFATDYARIRRQQCMQAAMLQQFTPATVLTRFEGIVSAGTQIVTTNVPQSQLGTFVDLADRSRDYRMARLTIGAPDFGTAHDRFTTHPDYDLVHRRVAELLDEEPTKAGSASASAQSASPSATPLLALTAAIPTPLLVAEASPAATGTGGATRPGVDPDDPSTWPSAPTGPNGEPYSAMELMRIQDAGDEAQLVRIASTNDLCAPGG